MAARGCGGSVPSRMNATPTQIRPEPQQRRPRAADRRDRRLHAVLRDPTAPVDRAEATHGDDRTHTPPHGDALLQRR